MQHYRRLQQPSAPSGESICQIPRNSPKVRNSSSRSSKVIDLGANRKHIYTFLLTTNINFGHISYCLRDIDAFSSKIACFPSPHTCLMPHSGWTPCNINITYTSLKSAFNGLQYRRWQYGSIFICGDRPITVAEPSPAHFRGRAGSAQWQGAPPLSPRVFSPATFQSVCGEF